MEKIDLDLNKEGYALCIIDSKSSHADLTDAYAGIPREMKAVASVFGKTHLRGVTKEQLIEKTAAIRKVCGDRAFLRAMHFVLDNQRAQDEAAALKAGDFAAFLEIVKASGQSSYMYLQNISVEGAVCRRSPFPVRRSSGRPRRVPCTRRRFRRYSSGICAP